MARGSIIKRSENSYRVMVSYTNEFGKRVQVTKTAPSPTKAEKLKTALLAEIDKGTFVKPSKLTVKVYLEQWLDGQVRSTVGDGTQELYTYLCKKHIIPALGDIALGNLRPQHIQKLYSDKLIEGLSPRTVQLLHVALHKSLKCATRTGLLVRNPMDVVDQPKVERHEMKTMTEDNIKLFLDKARNGDYYSLFFTLLFTGVRRGEALSLRWGDIDLLGAKLSVNRTMQFINNQVSFKAPKTKSSRRQIDLSPATCAVLRLHREKMNGTREYMGLPLPTNGDLVFSHANGEPLLPNSVTHAWIKLRRRCNLDDVSLHGARHSHATILLKSGVSPKVIQERLGHASFSTTMNLYAHVSPGMQKAAANRFDDMVIGNSKDNCVTNPLPFDNPEK
jgi:integrase